jgi:hypothetical protein
MRSQARAVSGRVSDPPQGCGLAAWRYVEIVGKVSFCTSSTGHAERSSI